MISLSRMLCFGQVCASPCALNVSAALQGAYRIDRTSSTLPDDLSLRHPRNFGQVPAGAMEELCKYLLRFDDSTTPGQLRIELQNLGNQWLPSK